MSKTFKRLILGISAALVFFVLLGGSTSLTRVRAGTQYADGAYREMGVFEDVLKKVQTDYVIEPNMDKVTDGALHGLLESLDADSSYLSPAEYKIYKDNLAQEKSGKDGAESQVGLVVSKRFGYATVVTVVPGSPADKAEIQDGDILESIEGQSTREMSVAMIRLLLEGKPGTSLTISLVKPRKAEPDKLTLTRTAVPEPALAEQQYESSTILYLKPGELTPNRVDEIDSKLRASQKAGGKKILLDLRDIAGGDEAQGISLANAFLQTGTIATLAGQKFPTQTFAADRSKFITSAPLVVLVNHGTSGAAEIAAAAILDSKRGKLVGDRTFGEGAVEKTFELPDGSALILSIAKYASPSGKKIQDEAVTPNVTVASNQDADLPEDDAPAGSGPAITGTPAKPTPPTNEAKPGPKADEQLEKALELLKQTNQSAQQPG